jgi:hypothetical protein
MVATMQAEFSRLKAGEFLKIHDGKGRILAVFEGLVWVTQYEDLRDDFVGKGGRSRSIGWVSPSSRR